LTFELDSDKIEVNQQAKYPGQRSLSQKLYTHRHTDTHTRPTALSGPLSDRQQSAPLLQLFKLRLHDTTGCQTGCQTGLTTGLTTVLNEQLFVQPVVKPGCTTVLTTGLTTGCIVYTNIYPVVKPV